MSSFDKVRSVVVVTRGSRDELRPALRLGVLAMAGVMKEGERERQSPRMSRRVKTQEDDQRKVGCREGPGDKWEEKGRTHAGPTRKRVDVTKSRVLCSPGGGRRRQGG